VDHYENFPVASLLCPPALRPAVAAIYWFARTADDLADEGDTPPALRLADLAAYRTDLDAALLKGQPSARWPPGVRRAERQPSTTRLSTAPAARPAHAFEQDVRNPRTPTAKACWTTAAARPTRWGGCCCTCTACTTPTLQRSDAICSALQLINFWQDLGWI
jgi:phytoene/squalene synthetase